LEPYRARSAERVLLPTRKERDKSKDIERLDKHDKKYYFWQTPISHY